MSESRPCQLWIWYSPLGVGGVETFLLNMGGAAYDRDIRFVVAAVRGNDGPLESQYSRAHIELLDWSTFYPAFMGEGPSDEVRSTMAADLSRIRPTLIAVNDCVDFGVGASPLLKRLRHYCNVIDVFHLDRPDEDYLTARVPYLDTLDGVATTNRTVASRFENFTLGHPALPVRYIPNGVKVPEGTRAPAAQVLRILYTGRLVQEQKQVLELPRVLSKLREHGRDFAMTVVGDGPDRGALERILQQENLDAMVQLTGSLPPDQVLEMYRRHDVFLSLSKYEGFSMSLIEALASGCVPVLPELPSLDRDLLRDGENCRLYPPDRLDLVPPLLDALTADACRHLATNAQMTGRSLTAEKMFDAYGAFSADLSRARPPKGWPEDTRQIEEMLASSWDLTEANPWLPRPHPLRRLARRLVSGVRSGAGTNR